ncbi:uncharacterized protein TNCV_3506651 [Trichonephila clavipes]|uniref:Uncharacterized protein n=1 Tax=Trichonephila clavipes TaxID=2585209 RepID=A0A8X6S1K9_TRICX|nr:uncharacterized protein TNCV_3506651 [Trichonephila clavipes]
MLTPPRGARPHSLRNTGLYGKTQNENENFNGILWKFISKDIFVELQTMRLGAHMAVIQFNKGLRGMLDVLDHAQIQVSANTEKGSAQLDEERVSESKRHSLSEVKTSRKKNRPRKKRKLANEVQEGITYKSGEF